MLWNRCPALLQALGILISGLLLGLGCSRDTNPAATDPPDGCSTDMPATCLYEPADQVAHTLITHKVVDEASIGEPRTFEIAVRMPTGVDGPRPIVIWTHGGTAGKTNALNSGPNWGVAFASAGYVAVNIAHPARSPEDYQPLCQHLGYATPDACKADFRNLRWDRPKDIVRVLDWLEEQAQTPDFAGRFDLDRIAIAGHSAGSGGTINLAGAPRMLHDTPYLFTDPRPDAFLLLSPQGPNHNFSDDAWNDITRPVFSATGSNDRTDNQTPENRTVPFQRMPPGDKYLLYLDHPGTRHTLFNLATDECLREIQDTATCDTLRTWIRSAALAFVDAYLMDRPEAKDWLASQDLETASDGIAEWTQR